MHYDFFRVNICTKKTLTTYETFLLLNQRTDWKISWRPKTLKISSVAVLSSFYTIRAAASVVRWSIPSWISYFHALYFSQWHPGEFHSKYMLSLCFQTLWKVLIQNIVRKYFCSLCCFTFVPNGCLNWCQIKRTSQEFNFLNPVGGSNKKNRKIYRCCGGNTNFD